MAGRFKYLNKSGPNTVHNINALFNKVNIPARFLKDQNSRLDQTTS